MAVYESYNTGQVSIVLGVCRTCLQGVEYQNIIEVKKRVLKSKHHGELPCMKYMCAT